MTTHLWRAGRVIARGRLAGDRALDLLRSLTEPGDRVTVITDAGEYLSYQRRRGRWERAA